MMVKRKLTKRILMNYMKKEGDTSDYKKGEYDNWDSGFDCCLANIEEFLEDFK